MFWSELRLSEEGRCIPHANDESLLAQGVFASCKRPHVLNFKTKIIA